MWVRLPFFLTTAILCLPFRAEVSYSLSLPIPLTHYKDFDVEAEGNFGPERVAKAIPLGRWGQPQEIAQGVAFLCSPAAGWITGEVLRVSGGLAGVSATPPKRAHGRTPSS